MNPSRRQAWRFSVPGSGPAWGVGLVGGRRCQGSRAAFLRWPSAAQPKGSSESSEQEQDEDDHEDNDEDEADVDLAQLVIAVPGVLFSRVANPFDGEGSEYEDDQEPGEYPRGPLRSGDQ